MNSIARILLLILSFFLAEPVLAAGAVSANMAKVDSLSDLKMLGHFDRSVVVNGYYRAGDGGGGIFDWNPTATSASDEIVTIAVPGRESGRWQRQMSSPLSVLACGALPVPDVDNAPLIQKCLAAAAEITIPQGDFPVSDVGVSIPGGRTLRFLAGARLLLIPSDKPNYEILRIRDASTITIYNPVIIGDKYSHRGSKGEWGMGISIRGGKQITIINPHISRCWGDAIYIGDGDSSTEVVLIKSAMLADNRRQGISIISGKSINIQDAVITGTSSKNPGVLPLANGPHAGIDIEPNGSANELGLRIDNLRTSKNQGYALAISLKGLTRGLRGEKKVSIEVTGHEDDGSLGGLLLGGWQGETGTITGKISLSGQQYFNSKRSAITIIDYPASMPMVFLKTPYLKNWGTAGLKSPKFVSAISFYNYSFKDDMGNIEISTPTLERTKEGPAWNDAVIYGRQSTQGKTIKNFKISTPKLINVSPIGNFWGQGELDGLELRRE